MTAGFWLTLATTSAELETSGGWVTLVTVSIEVATLTDVSTADWSLDETGGRGISKMKCKMYNYQIDEQLNRFSFTCEA